MVLRSHLQLPPVGVVLCAGLGTRLRAAYPDVAKPAVPFMGQPLAAYALAKLVSVGIEQIGVNTHHLPETVIDALEPVAQQLGIAIQYQHEECLLLTAGGAKSAAQSLRSTTTIIYHGDVICGVDLALALAAHRRSGGSVTLVCSPRNIDDPLGNVFIDESGDIVGLHEHRRRHMTGALRELKFCGIHIVESAVLDKLPVDEPACLIRDVYPQMLAEEQQLSCFVTTKFFSDMGTPQRMKSTFEMLEKLTRENPKIKSQIGMLG